eukprot:jgi/Botrbrau1/2324/Bobra.39_1s0013.1
MRGLRDGTVSFAVLVLFVLGGRTTALSDVKISPGSVKVTEPSLSGPKESGVNIGGQKHQENNGLSKAENERISEIVTKVMKARDFYESSDLSAKLLAERLEALQNYSSSPSKNEPADVVCPPPGFKTVIPFSLRDYISASWYLQELQLISYQPPSTRFCVKTTYIPLDPKNLTAGLEVFNYANFGAVNGPPIGGPNYGFSIISLRASVRNASIPSQLSVGPYIGGFVGMTLDFLGIPSLPFPVGPSWIIAAGPKTFGEEGFDGYKWVIVSAGPPGTPSNGACKNGRDLPWPLLFFDAGYWLLTRDPVASPELLAEMRAVGKSLGFDNSVLFPVEQKGCKYEGSKDVDPSLLL